jgi:hypothetical protein
MILGMGVFLDLVVTCFASTFADDSERAPLTA